MMMTQLKNTMIIVLYSKYNWYLLSLGGFIRQSFIPVEDLEMASFKFKCNDLHYIRPCIILYPCPCFLLILWQQNFCIDDYFFQWDTWMHAPSGMLWLIQLNASHRWKKPLRSIMRRNTDRKDGSFLPTISLSQSSGPPSSQKRPSLKI